MLLISLVSHGQGDLIKNLISDLNKLNLGLDVLVVLTLNIPEDDSFCKGLELPYVLIKNSKPLGFGANHNQAFRVCNSTFFLILNPDLRLPDRHIVDRLIENMNLNIAAFSPIVYGFDNSLQDSARLYPSLFSIFHRLLSSSHSPDYSFESSSQILHVEWVAGLFILFNSSLYESFNGFDEGYYMYLEDADICRRFNDANFNVSYTNVSHVIHDARRSSRKISIYTIWHLKSLIRFFLKFSFLRRFFPQ